MKSTADLILLASSNLIIDASKKSTADIIQIVGIIGLKGNHIIIRKANSKSTADLIMIASVYPKNITFDMTDNE